MMLAFLRNIDGASAAGWLILWRLTDMTFISSGFA